ncbi:MAG: hypothetical protein CM15mV19_1830 [uncultured marine virus]|nr:MAG: hypothetical protein CM15mV19_1830 [uncultured marine virus]
MYKNLKINVGEIYEGWKNKLLPDADMKEQIELVSTERMTICDACPNHSKNHKTLDRMHIVLVVVALCQLKQNAYLASVL